PSARDGRPPGEWALPSGAVAEPPSEPEGRARLERISNDDALSGGGVARRARASKPQGALEIRTRALLRCLLGASRRKRAPRDARRGRRARGHLADVDRSAA